MFWWSLVMVVVGLSFGRAHRFSTETPLLGRFKRYEQKHFPTLTPVVAAAVTSVEECGEKCLSLKDGCLAFVWLRGTHAMTCFLYNKVEEPEYYSDEDLYIKIGPAHDHWHPAPITQIPGGTNQQKPPAPSGGLSTATIGAIVVTVLLVGLLIILGMLWKTGNLGSLSFKVNLKKGKIKVKAKDRA